MSGSAGGGGGVVHTRNLAQPRKRTKWVEPEKHGATWEKPDTGHMVCDSICVDRPERHTHRGRRWMDGFQPGRAGAEGPLTGMIWGFFFLEESNRNVMKLDYGDGCTIQ